MVKMEQLNEAPLSEFVAILGEIFEHSPWVAEKAGRFRPFSSLQSLHERMVQVVEESALEDKLTLIRSHPNLGARLEMSTSSQQEQQNAGLHQLSPKEYESFVSLNLEYMNKFDFPFVVAVRGKSKQDIYLAMKERLHNSQEAEFKTALEEIYKIALFRLKEIIIHE